MQPDEDVIIESQTGARQARASDRGFILGAASSFLAILVIDNLGGHGSIYCCAGGLTAMAIVLVLAAALKQARSASAMAA